MEGKPASGGMSEISSMDRTSGFVRTLVRMQLSQNRRPSQGAMDRLYERMKERGEDVDFNPPKVSRRPELSHTSEQSSATEDDDDDYDAGVQVARSVRGRGSADNTGSAKAKELLRTSTGGFLYTPRRRSPMPRIPSPNKAEENTEDQTRENKVYTLRSANHSLAMNRGLTLAESVKRNYSRYIRTEKDEPQAERLKEREDASITEERLQLGPQTKDISLAETSVPDIRVETVTLSPPRVSGLMYRSSSSLGLITTVEEDLPGEMTRSNSVLSVPNFASLPATHDRAQMQTPDLTETHSTATRAQQRSRKRTVKKTERGRFRRRRSPGNREDRAAVIKELHKAHSLMDEHAKEVLLRRARARNEAYKRDQLLREEKMAIFQREMDDVMKRLRDINNRLDSRLKLLERDETLAKLEP